MPSIPQNDKKDLLCEAFSSFTSLLLIRCEQGREVVIWHAHMECPSVLSHPSGMRLCVEAELQVSQAVSWGTAQSSRARHSAGNWQLCGCWIPLPASKIAKGMGAATGVLHRPGLFLPVTFQLPGW